MRSRAVMVQSGFYMNQWNVWLTLHKWTNVNQPNKVKVGQIQQKSESVVKGRLVVVVFVCIINHKLRSINNKLITNNFRRLQCILIFGEGQAKLNEYCIIFRTIKIYSFDYLLMNTLEKGNWYQLVDISGTTVRCTESRSYVVLKIKAVFVAYNRQLSWCKTTFLFLKFILPVCGVLDQSWTPSSPMLNNTYRVMTYWTTVLLNIALWSEVMFSNLILWINVTT